MYTTQNAVALDGFSGFALPLVEELHGFRIDRFQGPRVPATAQSRGAVRAARTAAGTYRAVGSISVNDVLTQATDIAIVRDLQWLGRALCMVSAVLTVAGAGAVLASFIAG